MLCGLLLSAGVLRHYEVKHEQKLLDDYGKAMADMAASRAIDSTLNHDLVSLQVILQDVANNPRALLATIHDVENNLLVQAGDTKSLAHARTPKAYSAAIPVHDSVAGYVTVNLDTQLGEFGEIFYAFMGVSIVLALVALLSLQDMDGPFFMRHEPDAVPAPEPEAVPVPPLAERFTAHLQLRLVNLAVLKQQLSGDILLQLFSQLENSLVQILKQYPGRCRTTSASGRAQGVYQLEFYSLENALDAKFQAMCCAFLVITLNKHTKFKCLLQAVIGLEEDSVVNAVFSQDQAAVYCLEPEGIDPIWDDMIFYHELEGALQLSGFVPPLDDDIDLIRENVKQALNAESA